MKECNLHQTTILLARQRSGTNFLRSILSTNLSLHCFGEIFYPKPQLDKKQQNFFHFLKTKYENLTLSDFLDRQEKIFFDEYLEYLQSLHQKQKQLIDIKYNSSHLLNSFWQDLNDLPELFSLIKKNNIRVIQLTRKNYLRYLVSQKIAIANKTWVTTDKNKISSQKVQINSKFLLRNMQRNLQEDNKIHNFFKNYENFMTIDYTDLLKNKGDKSISPESLSRIASFLDVENNFNNESSLVKQSPKPLSDMIINYSEVAELLAETKFEYCLKDKEFQYFLVSR